MTDAERAEQRRLERERVEELLEEARSLNKRNTQPGRTDVSLHSASLSLEAIAIMASLGDFCGAVYGGMEP